MRNFTILFLAVVSMITIQAQVVSDTVSMGPSYANDVYYSLEDGYVSEYSGQEWTVAFFNSSMSASIMINEARGVALWIASENVADFATIDTTGAIGSWTQLHDSELIWDAESAFEDEPIAGQTNYGWGEYNFSNHQIMGSRVFVLKSINGTYYKVLVESKVAGVFNYRYATLDNTFDTTMVVTPPDLLGKYYAYLNMDNQTILDREPLSTDWDLYFTKYWDLYDSGFAPPAYASVTGVLINPNLGVAEVRNVPSADAVYNNQSFDTVKNVIGLDFKHLNSSFQWEVDDSLSYFLKTHDGSIYHLYFTSFGGTANGNVGFNLEKVSSSVTTNINASDLINLNSIYPNPSTGNATVLFSSAKSTPISLNVYSVIGELIYQTTANTSVGLNAIPVNLQNQENGVYLVQLSDGSKTSTQKLVLNK